MYEDEQAIEFMIMCGWFAGMLIICGAFVKLLLNLILRK